MFKTLPLFIALRYINIKNNNRFVSIILFISILSISLGIAVLITVMSVMNGFDYEIKKKILITTSPLKIYKINNKINNWTELINKIKKSIKSFTAQSFLIESEGLLRSNINNNTSFIKIYGIEPKNQIKILALNKYITNGTLSSLNNNKNYNIILGEKLANNLGLEIGDKVTLISSKINSISLKIVPRIQEFTISGLFSINYQYDNYYAFININKAKKFFGNNNYELFMQVGIKNIYNAPYIKNKLNNKIIKPYYIAYDWTDENKSFFNALKMEKTMMFFILLLAIIIAMFNLLSTLIIIIFNKRNDIAILRTMGMSSKTIITIFIYQGLIISSIGIIIGIFFGIFLSIYATEIVNCIQNIIGKSFLNTNIYFIDYIPSRLIFSDIIKIVFISIIFTLLAIIYPAWNATKIEPVNILKYE